MVFASVQGFIHRFHEAASLERLKTKSFERRLKVAAVDPAMEI